MTHPNNPQYGAPNPYQPPHPGPYRGGPYDGRFVKAHRGGAVLALGICGLCVCMICGIIAWSMGASDLREMSAGSMDRTGEGMTRAGKICGMISVILGAAVLAIYIVILAVAGVSGSL